MHVGKILIAGDTTESGLCQSLARAFRAIGWDVVSVNDQGGASALPKYFRNRYTLRLMQPALGAQAARVFLDSCVTSSPDIILVVKGYYYSPATLVRARQASPRSMLIHFNPDNTFNTWHFGNSNNWIRRSIPLYDLHLTWGEFLIGRLLANGAKRAEHLAFAYDENLHSSDAPLPSDAAQFGAQITFVGAWDEEREKFLSAIADLPIRIWGTSWNRAVPRVRALWTGRPVFGREFTKVVSCSHVNLNIIRRQNIPAHNMRTFEIPGMEGFMLATRTSEQEKILQEGTDIGCFGSEAELRDQLRFYLANADRRHAMAKNAQKKIRAMHTYVQRAKQIVGLSRSLKESVSQLTTHAPIVG